MDELIGALEEHGFEALGAVEFGAADELGFGVDGATFIAASPAADGVVVFEGKAEGIDAVVARGATGVGAMAFDLFAGGEFAAVGGGFIERGDVGGRGGGGAS